MAGRKREGREDEAGRCSRKASEGKVELEYGREGEEGRYARRGGEQEVESMKKDEMCEARLGRRRERNQKTATRRLPSTRPHTSERGNLQAFTLPLWLTQSGDGLELVPESLEDFAIRGSKRGGLHSSLS